MSSFVAICLRDVDWSHLSWNHAGPDHAPQSHEPEASDVTVIAVDESEHGDTSSAAPFQWELNNDHHLRSSMKAYCSLESFVGQVAHARSATAPFL